MTKYKKTSLRVPAVVDARLEDLSLLYRGNKSQALTTVINDAWEANKATIEAIKALLPEQGDEQAEGS